MMVEEPVYYFSITGFDGVVVDGADAVKDVYHNLAETQTCVMLVENEHLWVDDWGFASDSNFVTYQPGHNLIEKGFELEHPPAYYRNTPHFATACPYLNRA